MFNLIAAASQLFFGKGGSGIGSESSDVAKIWKAGGTEAGRLKVAPAEAASEATTLEQVEAIVKAEGSVKISAVQTNDTVVADGLYVIAGAGTTLTDSNGDALEVGYIYLSDGATYTKLDWAEVPVAVSLVTADDGDTISITKNHAYSWDTDNLTIYDLGSTVTEFDSSGVQRTLFATFGYGESEKNITIPAGATIVKARVYITESFNETIEGVNFSDSLANDIMVLADVNAAIQGCYHSENLLLSYTETNTVTCSIDASLATQGSATFAVDYVEA